MIAVIGKGISLNQQKQYEEPSKHEIHEIQEKYI